MQLDLLWMLVLRPLLSVYLMILPLYEEAKISIYLIAFERPRGEMPEYITRLLIRISDLHSRNTRYANYNLVCPKFKRKLDGGKTFNVTTCQL